MTLVDTSKTQFAVSEQRKSNEWKGAFKMESLRTRDLLILSRIASRDGLRSAAIFQSLRRISEVESMIFAGLAAGTVRLSSLIQYS